MAPLATRAPLAALAALSVLAVGALAAPCTSLPIAAGLTAASCACTQGNPASCTFPPETNATVGLNAVNPCVDHYVYLHVATGLQKAAADPKVAMPFSAPTPRTFCLNNFCGPNAGPAVQTFTAGCGAGYWGDLNRHPLLCPGSPRVATQRRPNHGGARRALLRG